MLRQDIIHLSIDEIYVKIVILLKNFTKYAYF